MTIFGPTRFDVWFMHEMVKLLGKHPLLDLMLQQGIRHDILGGFWFAAALFVLWSQSSQTGEERARRRLLTTFLGSVCAILLTMFASTIVRWLPPNQDPLLAHFYPFYIGKSATANSFPSQSTAVYSAIAAGIYSLHKLSGGLLWLAVAVLVAFPRMYVGGHYPSDIMAGVACGAVGYLAARSSEARLGGRIQRLLEESSQVRRIATLIIFVWIFQVATEFRNVEWLQRSFVMYTSPSVFAPANRLCIGGDFVFGQYFSGRIDEVRIYDHALSPEEIQTDMSTAISSTSNSASRASGLMAAYSFEEREGDAVADASGNSNVGIIRGAIRTSEGKFGRGLLFNGTSALVTINDSPTLHLSTGMTVEAWVYPTLTSGDWRDIVYKEVDAYFLEATSTEQGLPAVGGAFAPNTVTGLSPLPLNTWTHLAGTFDGRALRIYVNGVQAAEGR